MKTLYMIAMAPQGGNPGDSLLSTLIMFALIIGIFYFMIMRPQQKRAKERKLLLESVKKGDRVVTAGGMFGTVAGIDEKTVLIQVSDTTKIKFERDAVAKVLREGESGAGDGDKEKK